MSAPRHRSSYDLLAAIMLSLSAAGASAESTFEESFDRRQLRAESWNGCQAVLGLNALRPVDGRPGSLAYGFGIDADVAMLSCRCQTRFRCAHPVQMPGTEPLLYQAPVLPVVLPKGDPCKDYDRGRMPTIRKPQKNELRLWREDWPQAAAGTWFSIRFRIEGAIDRCGSMRWVGGQIKAHGMDESPFVAQRFDNGVFHITVEGQHRTANRMERVIVAKGSGDPDRGSTWSPLSRGETVTCDMSTGTPRPDGCGIAGDVAQLGGSLPSIDGGRWIQMDYYVRLRGKCDLVRPAVCDRLLEIWADGSPVARVTGRFGAAQAEQGLLNIKLGIYRDLQAGNAGISVDEFPCAMTPTRHGYPPDALSVR